MSAPVAFITGAWGFLGAHTAQALATRGWTVAGLGHDRSGRASPGLACAAPGPIDAEALARAASEVGAPDVIVHAAGGSSVGASIDNPTADFQRTVGATFEVLEFIRRCTVPPRLVFISSAAVYGQACEGPIPETTARRPISPYGIHKALAEDACMLWAERYGLAISIVRLFSVYGEGLRKQLLWDIARKVAAFPERLVLSGAGTERRDFIHVSDAAELLYRLGGREGAGVEIVNGGGGGGMTIEAAVRAYLHALSPSSRLEFDGVVRAGDPSSLVADISRARSFGYEPSVDFAQGSAAYARWASAEAAMQGAAPSQKRVHDLVPPHT